LQIAGDHDIEHKYFLCIDWFDIGQLAWHRSQEHSSGQADKQRSVCDWMLLMSLLYFTCLRCQLKICTKLTCGLLLFFGYSLEDYPDTQISTGVDDLEHMYSYSSMSSLQSTCHWNEK